MTQVAAGKTHKGRTSYHAGAAAEAQVAQDYMRRGHRLAAQRWLSRWTRSRVST